MWFWLGLEILRLVYKKRFFLILISFYLIWAFNYQKHSTITYKSWKKISSKLGVQGIKRSGILRWFTKFVELLRQEVSKDFFSEKSFFWKIFQVPKNSVFLLKIFSLLPNSRLLHFFEISAQYPACPISKKFFKTLIRCDAIFFKG